MHTGYCIFILVFISSVVPSFVFVGILQKVKHAWPHTLQGEQTFELNIQNSLLLLKLSGLPNSDELSTMTQTKTGEIQGPLKPEEFSQAFAFSTCKYSPYLIYSVEILFLIFSWYSAGQKDSLSREAKSPGIRDHD